MHKYKLVYDRLFLLYFLDPGINDLDMYVNSLLEFTTTFGKFILEKVLKLVNSIVPTNHMIWIFKF